MDDVIKFIRELGFPAAVAFFVLWRLERAMRELHSAVLELARLIAAHETTGRLIVEQLDNLLRRGGR